MKRFRQVWVHWAFICSLILKGINGALEVVGGILLWALSYEKIRHIVDFLTQGELKEDPNDLIANFFLRTAKKLSLSDQIYGGIFLLSHGVIKLALIAALFQKKLWAYPIAIFVFSLFTVYQMYRFFLTHSFWMVVISVFDVFVIIVTYLEYRRLQRLT